MLSTKASRFVFANLPLNHTNQAYYMLLFYYTEILYLYWLEPKYELMIPDS